jgi:hypothetical protein
MTNTILGRRFHSSSWMAHRTAQSGETCSPQAEDAVDPISSSVFCDQGVSHAHGWSSVPLKIASPVFSPLTVLTRWPPRTHWMASTMLLLPVPFGPMMMVMPLKTSLCARERLGPELESLDDHDRDGEPVLYSNRLDGRE